MIERFGRLPVPLRMAAAALAMALATIIDLVFIAKTSPWRFEVLLAAGLGALAAWPFKWRARTSLQKAALITAIALFGAGMVYGRVNGYIASSFAFIFSVILLSLPVQRARGFMEPRGATQDSAGESG